MKAELLGMATTEGGGEKRGMEKDKRVPLRAPLRHFSTSPNYKFIHYRYYSTDKMRNEFLVLGGFKSGFKSCKTPNVIEDGA